MMNPDELALSLAEQPDERPNQVRGAMTMGAQFDPESYAKAMRTAAKTGVAPSAVLKNQKQFDKMPQIDPAELVRLSPKTAAWLVANVDNAAISSDDLPNLTGIEDAYTRAQTIEAGKVEAINKKGSTGFIGGIKSLASSIQGGTGGLSLSSYVAGGLGSLAAMPETVQKTIIDTTVGRAFGSDASKTLSTISKFTPAGLPMWLMGKAGRGISETVKPFQRSTQDMFIKDPVTGKEFFNYQAVDPTSLNVYESAANLIAQEAPSMAAMALITAATGGTTAPVAAAKYGKFLGTAAKVAKYATRPAALIEVGRTIQGQRDNGIQELMAKGRTREQAEIEVAPGALLAGALSFGLAAPLEAKLMEDLLQKVALAPNGKTFATRMLSRLQSATTQGAKEGVQEVVNGIGEDMAAWLTYNPDKTFREAAQNAAQNFFGGAVLGGAFGGLLHSAKTQTTLDEMVTLSKESKLRGRAPEKFAELAKEIVGEETIQIPAESVQTYFQSKNLDPGQAMQSAGAQNYLEALAAGTEVVIPLHSYLANIAADHHEGLAPDVRMGQGAMTPREMEAYQAESQKVEAQVETQGAEAVKAQDDPNFQRIYDDTVNQLLGVGMSPRVAETEAIKHAAVMSNLAGRAQAAGLDPEMVLRWQPRITRPAPGASLVDRVLSGEGDGQSTTFYQSNPMFYSALQRVVPDLSKIAGKDGMVSPDQASSWLASRQKEGKFKQAELDAIGLSEWLALQKGKVSVEDIKAFVEQNGVQIQEVEKSTKDPGAMWGVGIDQFAYLGNKNINVNKHSNGSWNIWDNDNKKNVGPFNSPEEAKAEAIKLFKLKPPKYDKTKFSEYTLPGGKNYKELLLTLPASPLTDVENNLRSDLGLKKAMGSITAEEQSKLDSLESRYKGDGVFKSAHWDEPNILAHIRFNERTGADGERVLFIEEIQSDWGQKGKKEGFDNEEAFQKLLNDRDAAPEGSPRQEGIQRQIDEMQAKGGKGVPSAPFVTDTKAWVALSIKRMIRYAAENGFDKIAFVNGEQSAERYDLSKQVNSVSWIKSTDGAVDLYVVKEGEREDIRIGSYKPEELPDVIGKDLSNKINEDFNNGKKEGEYSGLDLKVGGEGMKTFYDKIVPQVAGEVLKKMGGGKVGEVQIGEGGKLAVFANGDMWDVERNGKIIGQVDSMTMEDALSDAKEEFGEQIGTQLGFDITPEMKAKALEGQTLFQDDRKMRARGALGRALSPSGQSAELTRRAGEAQAEEAAFAAFDAEVKGVQAGNVMADASENNAFIQFGDGPRVQIGLLEKSNLSSLTHEFSHLYYEIITDIASAPNPPEQIVKDLARIREYVGADPETMEPLSREQHEKLARAGEAYLLEGKAPSEKLKGVFARVKYWMLGVYRSISGLGVKLNDDVRAVFDRIYASDVEIDQARQDVGDLQLFAKPEDMGATQAEFDSYVKAKAKEIQKAKDSHAAKVLAEIEREKTQWWEAESDKVRAEVTAEVDADRLYKTFNTLVAGKMEDGTEIKLNKDALEARFGKGVGKELPRGKGWVYTREGGMDADSAAELLGWPSGQSMIESLKNLEPRRERIDRLTEQRMKDTHGDLMAPEALAESAMEAIHEGDPGSKHTELRILRKRENETRGERKAKEQEGMRKSEDFWRRGVAAEVPPLETFRRAAVDLIEAQQTKDLSPFRYLQAQRVHSQEAFRALAKGDYAKAADSKQKEILNHFLYREASRAKAESEGYFDYMQKFAKKATRQRIGKAGGEQGQRVYLDQILGILDQVQFVKESKASIEARQSLAEFMVAQAEAGEMLGFDPAVLNQKKNYRELTITELRAVVDSIKNIESIADRDSGMIIDGKKILFDDAKDELTGSAYGNLKSKPLPLDKNARSIMDKIVSKAKALDSELLKMEELVDRLDGGDINGPWRRYVFEPMCKAQVREFELNQAINEKLTEAMETMPKEQRLSMADKFDIQGMGTVTRKFILSMAMNMGNASNKEKMIEGFMKDPAFLGVDPEVVSARVGAALDNLSRPDWEFVQKTWDALGSLWPEIEALELRMTGLAPARVEVQPFTVKLADGTEMNLDGGYYPVVYDPEKSGAGKSQDIITGKPDEAIWSPPVTSKGHTKERVKFAAPMLMDFEQVLAKHVARVVKDLSHREPATSVSKLLRNQEVRTAVQETLGPEYEKQLMPWLKGTVNDVASMNPELGKWLLQLRSNMVVASLAFRASSVIVQATDFGRVLIGHHRVSPRYLSESLASMARHPIETVRMIRELSPEMAQRAMNLDRDTRAVMRKLTGKEGFYAKSQEIGMKGLAIADLITSHTAWLGAYKQATAKGAGPKEAVMMADRVVRTKLMSGAPKDLTAIQRKGSGAEMLTVYMGDAVAVYGMMSRGVKDISQGKNIGSAAFAMLMAGMIIPILGDLLKGKGPGDEDDEIAWAKRKAIWSLPSSIPLIRDVASAFESGRDYQFTPLAGVINKAKRAAVQGEKVASGEAEWDDWYLNGLDALGTLGGIPGTSQAMTSLRYAKAVEEGKQSPDGPTEYTLGLVFGPKRSKK